MRVQTLSLSSDIVHQISPDTPGGVIKSHDFVMERHWRCFQGGLYDNWTTCWITGGISVTHLEVPPTKQSIRGHNGSGCWPFTEREGALVHFPLDPGDGPEGLAASPYRGYCADGSDDTPVACPASAHNCVTTHVFHQYCMQVHHPQ